MDTMATYQLSEVAPGRRLHYLAEGPAGAPVILYDAGAFGIYADGWWIKEALKTDFQVITYDRAGMGGSDPVPAGQTADPYWHAKDMCHLLDSLGHTRPIVLIGHSMAGLRLHAFAERYPDRLAGLVFVDALSPRRFQETFFRTTFGGFGTMLEMGVLGARAGLAQSVAKYFPNNFKLDGLAQRDKTTAYGAVSHMQASRNEVSAAVSMAQTICPDAALSFPVAIFASTNINSLTQADADRAKANAGYGWYSNYPQEDHVSILVGRHAQTIAARARELHGLTSAAAHQTNEAARL